MSRKYVHLGGVWMQLGTDEQWEMAAKVMRKLRIRSAPIRYLTSACIWVDTPESLVPSDWDDTSEFAVPEVA